MSLRLGKYTLDTLRLLDNIFVYDIMINRGLDVQYISAWSTGANINWPKLSDCAGEKQTIIPTWNSDCEKTAQTQNRAIWTVFATTYRVVS